MDITQAKKLLASQNVVDKIPAAEWLSMNPEVAIVAAVELVDNVGHADRTVAEYCVATLEELGEPRHEDLPALARLAEQGNSDVAYWAVTLIGCCGTAAANQIGVVKGVQSSKHPAPVRKRAEWALGKIVSPNSEHSNAATDSPGN